MWRGNSGKFPMMEPRSLTSLIAHALTRCTGWGGVPPEPAHEEIGAKPILNAGSPQA